MHIQERTIDDLMNSVFAKLLDKPFNIQSRKGASSELRGVCLELSNPLARLSRSDTRGKPFSAIGELIWYLSGSDSLEFITAYIPYYRNETEDGKSIYGAYGPRLMGEEGNVAQLKNVIELLKVRPNSRNAVVSLYAPSDNAAICSVANVDGNANKRHVPCTCTFQFFVRDDKLEMITYMRSNDSYWGLPHDVFAFTMIQEIVAASVGVNLGSYKHQVGSLHLYENKMDFAKQYLDEGFQSTKKAMPPMPVGDPWSQIDKVVTVERSIRAGGKVLVNIHFLSKENHLGDIEAVLQLMNNEFYRVYAKSKLGL